MQQSFTTPHLLAVEIADLRARLMSAQAEAQHHRQRADEAEAKLKEQEAANTSPARKRSSGKRR